MTTLADINKTLEKQTQVLGAKQTYTSHRVDALTESFNDFFDMVKGDSYDDLEAQIEGENKRVDEEVKAKASTSNFNFKDLLGGMLGGLFSRGALAAIAALLSKGVGDAIKGLTGSELLANVTEWSTLGGAFGFLFGGVKGGILGAAIGAIFSDASRTKIAEILSEVFDKEIQATDTETLVAAGVASSMVLLAPAIIDKLLPLLLSPAGLLVMAAGASVGVALKYFTDDDFRKKADTYMNPIRDKVDELMAGIGSSVRDYLEKVFPDFITTDQEIKNIDVLLGPERLQQQKDAEAQLARATKIQEELRGESQAQPFSDTTRFQRINTFAKEQGINLSDYIGADGRKLSEYTGGAFSTDASMLSMEVSKILAARSEGARKLLEEIQKERDLIEQRLNAGEIVKPPENSGFHAHPALRKMSDSSQSSSNLSKPAKSTSVNDAIDGSVNNSSANTQIIQDNSSTTSIGQSSTAFVGSGTNSIDVNNPQLQRAMEAVVF